MRILITGGSSLPGYRAILALIKRGFNVIATYLTHEIPIDNSFLEKVNVDVRDYNALSSLFKRYRPDVVIHMAAYGDVDGCERNPSLAWEVNVKGTVNIVKLAGNYSDFILYLSTDYVFDGDRGNYSEFDAPYPVNYYGLTKLCGEVSVLSSNIDSAIVRASSIYGFGPGRKNFAKFLIERLSSNEVVRALTDQFTSPTQASLLADAISEIVENRFTGIFHIVGERLSRYDFALKVAEIFGFDKGLIREATMESFKWFARRPRDSSLNCDFTRKMLKTNFYSLEKALDILKREYNSVGDCL